jgi:hypothetical protein
VPKDVRLVAEEAKCSHCPGRARAYPTVDGWSVTLSHAPQCPVITGVLPAGPDEERLLWRLAGRGLVCHLQDGALVRGEA